MNPANNTALMHDGTVRCQSAPPIAQMVRKQPVRVLYTATDYCIIFDNLISIFYYILFIFIILY